MALRSRATLVAAALACAAGQIINTINVTAAVLASGFPTGGGATVLVGADNLPLGQPLHMTMRSAAFPGDLTCGCALLGSPTSSTPGMSMVRRAFYGRRERTPA